MVTTIRYNHKTGFDCIVANIAFSSMTMTSNDNKKDYINDDNDGNDLTRYKSLPSKPKAHVASGQGSHWLIESPKQFYFCVICPPEICVNLVLKHIHADSSYTFCI